MKPLGPEQVVVLATLQLALDNNYIPKPYLSKVFYYLEEFFIALGATSVDKLYYFLNKHPKKDVIRSLLKDSIDEMTKLGDGEPSSKAQIKKPRNMLGHSISQICRRLKLVKSNGRLKHKSFEKIYSELQANHVDVTRIQLKTYLTHHYRKP
jgi:hypothetical protein